MCFCDRTLSKCRRFDSSSKIGDKNSIVLDCICVGILGVRALWHAKTLEYRFPWSHLSHNFWWIYFDFLWVKRGEHKQNTKFKCRFPWKTLLDSRTYTHTHTNNPPNTILYISCFDFKMIYSGVFQFMCFDIFAFEYIELVDVIKNENKTAQQQRWNDETSRNSRIVGLCEYCMVYLCPGSPLLLIKIGNGISSGWFARMF